MTTKDISIIVNSGTGIEFNQQLLPVNIYPDPAVQYFIIDYSNRYFDFILFDPIGRTILNGRNVFQKIQIDCRNLDPGIYFVIITDRQGQSFTRKLVISR